MALTLASHNLPTDKARESFKPSADSANFLVSIEKNFFALDFGFSVYYVAMRASLCIVGRLCLALGASPMRPFFAQNFYVFVFRIRVFRALD